MIPELGHFSLIIALCLAIVLSVVPLWGAWQLSSYLLRKRAYAAVGFVPWFSNDLRLLCTNLAVAMRALPGRPLTTEMVEPAPGRRARFVMLTGLQVALAQHQARQRQA